jgi:hypothetical protein
MATNPFQNIQASPNFDLFKFESEGRTRLRKHIQFDLIDENENIYNLALCTVFPDGTLDCETETKNDDMDRVLETAAHIGMMYINKYPDRKVLLRGSDAKRSRKYQIGINRYLILLSKDYSIEGLNIVDGEIVNRELIRPGINYHAFLFGKLRK